MKKKLIDYIGEIAEESFENVNDYLKSLQSNSAIGKVNYIATVLLFIESQEIFSPEAKEASEKLLIQYIGEIDEVNYAHVRDFFKELQYNSPERNVELLEEVLLYVESHESKVQQNALTEKRDENA